MSRRRRRSLRPFLESLDQRRLFSGLTPAQLTAAYGLSAITFSANGTTVAGDGSGQTIAVIDAYHDPYLASDLNTFDQAYSLPATALTQIDLAGSSSDSGWAMEEALDVEWAHAIAPGAAIVVVEAKSDSIPDLMAAVAVAKQVAGVSVVSMSWGSSEFAGETAYDKVFTTPAGHTGITYVAASGDQGALGGAEWPASSPNVLAVGGTSLSLSPDGTYQGESVWTFSSGGVSLYESEPAYQGTVQSTGRRSTPDVSFDGDPNTGVSVYMTDPSTGVGSWSQIGGTSLGAPAWAAIVAIADQGRELAGKGTLDGATETMTALYSLPASDFHAVAATTGVSAGLGSPIGSSVVNGLVAYGTPATSASTTPTTTSTQSTTAIRTTRTRKRTHVIRTRRHKSATLANINRAAAAQAVESGSANRHANHAVADAAIHALASESGS